MDKHLPDLSEHGEPDDDFKARDYQEELLEKADIRNTILFLPTGAGKTYIAVMLIKRRLHEIENDINDGGKRTIFLVNNVPLVEQQAVYIRRFIPASVGAYNGSMKVDLWKENTWSHELRKHQVLVMTAEIFNQMLSHAYIKLENVNLIVFDECHHAVEGHPMRQIMQYFEVYKLERWKLPRVLGLTATILNMNIKLSNLENHIRNLETTFHASVATASDYSKVFRFSTNPDLLIMYYDPNKKENTVYNNVFEVIESAKCLISDYQFDLPVTGCMEKLSEVKLMDKKHKKKNKELKNNLDDLKMHIDTLGIYGGNEGALAYIIFLMQKREKAVDKPYYLVHSALITALYRIRKAFTSVMGDISDIQKIYLHSSNKLTILFESLEIFKQQWEKAEDAFKQQWEKAEDASWDELLWKRQTKPCVIVFVKRRFTAKVLYLIIQALAKHNPYFAFIKPDFMIGCDKYSKQNNTRDLYFENKLLERAVRRFGHETNLMVTTDVMEEGIDIPQCTLVVKFDEPQNYRSYVQSKGRARHKESKFIIMCSSDETSKKKLEENIKRFDETEDGLKEALIGCLREEPSIEDIEESVYDQQLPPYQPFGPEGPQVTFVGGISVINRYCMMLPHDRFTNLTPLWYMHKNEMKAYLQLPINSPLHDVVEGLVMSTKKHAKRAVALKACEMLHKLGELDDHLLPKRIVVEDGSYTKLFPLWETENAGKSKPGTKNMVREYHLKCPEYFTDCMPTEISQCYLHVLVVKPAFECPSECDASYQFFNVLNNCNGYALVSTKPLPKLCRFSIAMNVGKLEVEIFCNYSVLKLTSEQISGLKKFHKMLFLQLLNMCKSFIESNEKEYSYLIAPTFGDQDNISIDWDIVNSYTTLPDVKKPTVSDLLSMEFSKEKYFLSIVCPWYRGTNSEQHYLVTDVCEDLSPNSPFPDSTDDFKTFREYFHKKYGLKISHEQQPLLKVKGISQNLNMLYDRRDREAKRARHETVEYLVPELCTYFSYPAVLWIKAKCIPSILHRISHLLLAEELRHTVALSTGIGVTTASDAGFEWAHLDADEEEVDRTESYLTDPALRSALSSRLKKYVISDYIKNNHRNDDDEEVGDEEEPKDLYRNAYDITYDDVVYYEKYLKMPLPRFNKKSQSYKDFSKLDFGEAVKSLKRSIGDISDTNCINNIRILEKDTKRGPELPTVLKALTSASADDMFNLERLETLGDSYLKFIVALFLFSSFPSLDEGKLSTIKDKLIGNRNLFYCGKHIQLPNIMKVHNFFPKSNWIPPGFMINPELCKILSDNGNEQIAENVDEIESLSENIQSTTSTNCELMDCEETSLYHSVVNTNDKSLSFGNSFLSKRKINDKSVADSVEALIGVYLQSSGIRGALSFLHWLQVLPVESASLFEMFDKAPPTAKLNPKGDVDLHLKYCHILEETLSYTFNDRSYLLQALTHPSFTSNRVTDCYQRLEFLGDAVLDFLITCYIYENCGKLTPGQLTDLRSALVNNVTFASLSVRYGFHKHLQFRSVRLMEIINRFVSFQEENDHRVSEEVLILLEERDTNIAEAIEVPKVLGDLFESIAGAIYLDSGKSLSTVWRIYSRLMKTELDEFTKQVPKQSIRLLHEVSPNKPTFLKSTLLKEQNVTMVPLELYIKNKIKTFHGFGVTKKAAKLAAAKLALRSFLASTN